MDYNTIKRYCTKKLAQILYDNVECLEAERAEIDWRTAESHISDSSVVCFLGHAVKRNVKNYNDFERELGRLCWDGLYQAMKENLPKEYGRIKFH